MILLDTNICIYIINAKPQAVLERFQQYRVGEVGLCSVVAAELAFDNPREFFKVPGLQIDNWVMVG